MSERRRRGGRSGAKRRRRTRPVPAWLMKREDLDAMARRRCLLILSVLSGEKSVSDAIEEAQISRPLYYDLESRGLAAMLTALIPTNEKAGAPTAQGKIDELEAKVKKLEQEKRRVERLLFLTRQLVKPGSMKTASGRKRRVSTSVGKKSSTVSAKTKVKRREENSIPTKDGEGAH